MSLKFITPFSNMVLWTLLLVALVATKCSSLELTDNNYKFHTTPIPPPPPPAPYHENHSPSYPESLIPNNNNNKPPLPVFDYLKLAKVWVPTFCKIKTCVDNPPSVDFSLHGLWPQNNSDPQPNNCQTTQIFNWHVIKRVDKVFWEYLKNNYPVLDEKKEEGKARFWSHEWTDHGTCAANMSPEKYFELSITISQKLDLKAILQTAGIRPGPNIQVGSNAISNAIEAAISNSKPQIACQWINNKAYLYQVIVCLDKTGDQYVNCVPGNPRESLIKCPKSVFFPIRIP